MYCINWCYMSMSISDIQNCHFVRFLNIAPAHSSTIPYFLAMIKTDMCTCAKNKIIHGFQPFRGSLNSGFLSNHLRVNIMNCKPAPWSSKCPLKSCLGHWFWESNITAPRWLEAYLTSWLPQLCCFPLPSCRCASSGIGFIFQLICHIRILGTKTMMCFRNKGWNSSMYL